MARTPFNAIQKAVYDQLVKEAASWPTPADVYDDVPENAPFPYVELGQFTDLPEETKSTDWSTNVQAVNVWSELRGTKELNDVINEVVQALVNEDLLTTLEDDFRVISISRDLTEVFKVLDPTRGAVVRQGVVRIQFKVEDQLSA